MPDALLSKYTEVIEADCNLLPIAKLLAVLGVIFYELGDELTERFALPIRMSPALMAISTILPVSRG
jgi:hypothetical protein